MPLDDTLFFPVFEYLRKEGVPLGISEYLLALETAYAGLGLESLEDLASICRLLWAKSPEDQALFDYAFNRYVRTTLSRRVPEKPAAEYPPADVTQTRPVPDQPLPPLEKKEPTETTGTASPPTLEEPFTANPHPIQELMQISLSRPWESETESSQLLQSNRYLLSPHLHTNLREMATAWRHLRLLQRSGPAEELDVDATIEDICHNGFFVKPRLVPRRRNQADLLVLIDQDGSMIPFSLLVHTLVESILRGGRLDQVSTYYFHDIPDGYLFARPDLSQPVPIEDVLPREAVGRSSVIVSDGGAARGNIDDLRLQATRSFLELLDEYTLRSVWLNPLPAHRWKNTTAGKIARYLPMFPLNRDGLNDAVSHLRGQPVQ